MEPTFCVDTFTEKETEQIKEWADDLYHKWLVVQGKEKPVCLEDLAKPAALYIQHRVRPYVFLGDKHGIWGFRNLDLAACWLYILEQIVTYEDQPVRMKAVCLCDSEIRNLGWDGNLEIMLAPVCNGEK